MATVGLQPLYRPLELAFCTQYAEVKERCRAAGPLLPGTPGLLALREGTGHRYWYRRYYAIPNHEVEDFVCKDGDELALRDMRSRIEFCAWTQEQVRALRRLNYQVADKDVPGMRHSAPSTSVKRPGAEGVRVDVLTPGRTLGRIVPVPELEWHAQTVPQYDYLLSDPREAAALAGGHCIPVKLPTPERYVWHKLYSSAVRLDDAAKAQKDLLQAATLAAVLVEQDDASFEDSAAEAPAAVLRAARTRLTLLRQRLAAHPQTLAQFEAALA